MSRLLIVLSMVTVLAACGLKGPLKLPHSTKPQRTPTATNPAQPQTNGANSPPAPVSTRTNRSGQPPTDSPGSTTAPNPSPN